MSAKRFVRIGDEFESPELSDLQRDMLRVMPRSDAKRGMTQKDMERCIAEVEELRTMAALIKLFDAGKIVPRVRDGEIYWFDRQAVEDSETT